MLETDDCPSFINYLPTYLRVSSYVTMVKGNFHERID